MGFHFFTICLFLLFWGWGRKCLSSSFFIYCSIFIISMNLTTCHAAYTAMDICRIAEPVVTNVHSSLRAHLFWTLGLKSFAVWFFFFYLIGGGAIISFCTHQSICNHWFWAFRDCHICYIAFIWDEKFPSWLDFAFVAFMAFYVLNCLYSSRHSYVLLLHVTPSLSSSLSLPVGLPSLCRLLV